MSGQDFLDEQRRRQRELVRLKQAQQNPDLPLENDRPEQPQEAMTFKKKTENFWFYNKYFVIAAVFLAVTMTIAVAQCAGRIKYDYHVVLFSYNAYITGQIDALEEELAAYGEDQNGDGEVHVQVIDCSFSDNDAADIRNAKQTKLTATISSDNEAVLFITDTRSMNYLDSLFDTDFFVNLGLPDDNGKSIVFDKAFEDKVNAHSENGLTIPDGLRISRRIAGDTTVIGKSEKTKDIVAAADKLLEKMSSK